MTQPPIFERMSDPGFRALKQLVSILAAIPLVERVVLFGSRARGSADERADIDLAVSAPEAGIVEWMDIEERVDEADTLLPIDLVWWEQASTRMKEWVKQEGVVLYERTARSE